MKKRIATKKTNFLKRMYLDCLKLITENKNYIFFAIGLFVLSFIIGLIFHPTGFVLNFIEEIIKNLISQTANLNFIQLVMFIFLNNLKTSFLCFFSGLLFGIIPLFLCLLNGYLVGFISEKVISESSIFQLWRLFPHGIFELPAVFISLGLGLKLGALVLGYTNDKSVFDYLKRGFFLFIFIILPLLLIAAFIEGFLIKWLG